MAVALPGPVPDEPATCKHCGATLSLARIMKLDEQGEYEYLCESCAVEAGTGQVPESQESS